MEPIVSAPAPASTNSRTSPKDFFLWLGVIVTLYSSITALIALLFQYINYAFPDNLADYSDPYGAPIRIAMATVLVMVPTMVIILRLIRSTIEKEPGKANIWVRRWALGLTLFIATISILIDLITLINTFLGGEISTRFELKVLVVLLVAAGVFMHFLADMAGYWITNTKKATYIGIGVCVLAVAVIVSGFFIIGSPQKIRMLRYDDQKVNDLQSLQYQVVNHWQVKRALPADLNSTVDLLSGQEVPMDPQSKAPYGYKVTGPYTFELCADFNLPTPETEGRGEFDGRNAMYYTGVGGISENWKHEAGNICFSRTIDPDRYQVFPDKYPQTATEAM
ncbi:MAG: hypothetical protein AB203_00570 [Parcubacteria bacterium C7867-008]|nr:MAG: hypothetical protein AB203_00570 [Parcubacteria bacterium C7867-008]